MITDRDILKAFGERMVSTLRARIPKATGRTADAVRMEITDDSLKIYAPITLKALVDGRGPSKSGGKSDTPLWMAILEWMDVRGISGTPYQRKDGTMQDQFKADVSLAHMIANKIHKKGYKGNESILKEWVKESELKELASRIGQNRRQEIVSDILKQVA